MARLFFALWPDAVARTALAELTRQIADRLGGRPVSPAKLHLTLLFLGEVDPARIGALCHAVEGIACRAFAVRLDRVGGFQRTGIAWAGCGEIPEDHHGLHDDLDDRVRGAGFHPDRRAFAPHLTLARRVREPVIPGPLQAISWPVQTFSLAQSVGGEGAYRILAEWPVGPGKT